MKRIKLQKEFERRFDHIFYVALKHKQPYDLIRWNICREMVVFVQNNYRRRQHKPYQ